MAIEQPIVSICIPVKDFDVNPLVLALLNEIRIENLKAEILIVEDGSSLAACAINKNITLEKEVRLYTFPENKGRSTARNYLAKMSHGTYLIFIDADSIPIHPRFISHYLANIQANTILCGGRHYSPLYKTKNSQLHWKYGTKREVRHASGDDRTRFYSNNFLVEKSTFETIRFDESIVLYGHEDTLFGYVAKTKGVQSLAIENAVIHTSIETNEVFLSKIEESVFSLKQIIQQQDLYSECLRYEFTLWNTYEKLSTFRLLWIIRGLSFFKKPMRYSLVHFSGPLVVLDFYKLVLLDNALKKQ